MAGKQTLDKWIHEALTDSDKDGPCGMLTLVHISGGGDKEIHTVRFGGKAWKTADLARLFKGKAEGYAGDLPGVQMFALLAFYKNKEGEVRDEPEARKPFNVNGELDYGGMATEGPTPQGLVSQSLRHNELLAQTYIRGHANVIDAQAQIISILSANNIKLLEENSSALEVVKTLVMEKATDTHKLRMEQLEFSRKSSEREKWLSLVAPLTNTIFGKEVFSEATEAQKLFEAAAVQLSPEQIKGLAAVLPPEIWAPMSSLLGNILKKKRESEEHHEELAQRINPKHELGESNEPSESESESESAAE